MARSKAQWAPPTTPEPSVDQIGAWIMDQEDTEATDGCITEPDGTCEHGYPSWLRYLGYI